MCEGGNIKVILPLEGHASIILSTDSLLELNIISWCRVVINRSKSISARDAWNAQIPSFPLFLGAKVLFFNQTLLFYLMLMVDPSAALFFLPFRRDRAKFEQWTETRQKGLKTCCFFKGAYLVKLLHWSPKKRSRWNETSRIGSVKNLSEWNTRLSRMMLRSHFTGFKTKMICYQTFEGYIHFSKCFGKLKHFSSASSWLRFSSQSYLCS